MPGVVLTIQKGNSLGKKHIDLMLHVNLLLMLFIWSCNKNVGNTNRKSLVNESFVNV